jgi:FOG: CBS domain
VQVFEFFQKDLSLSGICVSEDGYVIGIVTRNELYKRLSGQYGYTLYSKKPISSIMNGTFLQVDGNESIETVAKKAMGRGYENLYDFITVTRNGKYLGIVTIKDLLEKSFQVELYNAIHVNPLSQLPGNVLIENELEKCINSPYEYTVLYFDINNFKAYNDVYGFETATGC